MVFLHRDRPRARSGSSFIAFLGNIKVALHKEKNFRWIGMGFLRVIKNRIDDFVGKRIRDPVNVEVPMNEFAMIK